MAYFVALDGGGTKTECWVADETRVLGRASTGTVKLMSVDEPTATARLETLLHDAAAEAGVALDRVQRICFGLAGSSSGLVRGWARLTLERVAPHAELLLTGDEETAFEAAFRGGAGVLVIAGTGMNVMGRCVDGKRFSAGGWGPMLGDEGSGYWIGLEAIRAALRAEERGITSCLLADIERFRGLSSRAELVAFAHQRERPAFGELTVIVARCADEGDALAQSVLQRAGEELAESVALVASKMRAADCATGARLQVAFTGSVLAKIPRVRRSMEGALTAHIPGVVVGSEAVQPLEGALWMARRG